MQRRGLPTRGLKEDLIKRLLRGHGAQALTEEAAAALLFVRRRLGSRPGGLALTDDAGAIGWIVEACKEKSSTTMDAGTISDVRRRSTKAEETLDEAFGKQPRCEGLQVASLGARQRDLVARA